MDLAAAIVEFYKIIHCLHVHACTMVADEATVINSGFHTKARQDKRCWGCSQGELILKNSLFQGSYPIANM